MESSERLTEQERLFAERHHKSIYTFHNTNGLRDEDFYDVAALGYLRAVKRYHREEKLQQYKFNTIAWQAMRTNVGNKKKADRIRDAVITCSLNELTDDGTEYGEFVQTTKDGFRELEEQENLQQLLAEIMPALTERQRGHIVAALNGYRPQEIIKEQRVRFQEYHKDRKVIREVIRDVIPVFRGGGIKLWTDWKLLDSWRACGNTVRA